MMYSYKGYTIYSNSNVFQSSNGKLQSVLYICTILHEGKGYHAAALRYQFKLDIYVARQLQKRLNNKFFFLYLGMPMHCDIHGQHGCAGSSNG